MSEGTAPEGFEREPWRLKHLLIVVVAAALILFGFRVIGGWMVVLAVFSLLALVVGMVVVGIRGRASQRYSLLWMLAIATEHGMPLATTVQAFADQYRGRFRRRVLDLSLMLDNGSKLSYALRTARGLVAPDTAVLIEVGEGAGKLSQALRQAASIQAGRTTIGTTLSSQAAYLLMVLLVVQAIVNFLVFAVMPRFNAIFSDFGIGLPWATMTLFDLSQGVVTQVFLMILLPFLTLVLLIIIPRALSIGSSIDLPLVGRLFRKRHTSLILRSLAMTVDAGRPIEQGLWLMAERYPTRWVRNSLAGAGEAVQQGRDWREALARRDLIGRAEYDVLRTASAVGNLPWAMNDLADTADRRLRLRIAMLSQILWPVVIMAVGAMTLFLTIGFFGPLVELIRRLS